MGFCPGIKVYPRCKAGQGCLPEGLEYAHHILPDSIIVKDKVFKRIFSVKLDKENFGSFSL